MGGLGNQLFEIAAAYAHCKRTGQRLLISPRTSPNRPTYWTTFLEQFAGNVCSTEVVSTNHWREPAFHYVSIPSQVTSLFGYFQSSKYFSDCTDDIRKLFRPALSIQEKVATTYANLLTEEQKCNNVVLHIRRGDYVALPTYHCILTPAYYQRVITEMQTRIPNAQLLVFSDDLEWCKSLPFLKGAIFVDEPDESVALWLMSQFRHFIQSNSSFSWWATWLANAHTVLTPAVWFGRDGPQDYYDIYEPSWSKMQI